PAAGFQPVSGLPWSTVQAYLGGVSFAEDSADTGNVKVCEECNAFRARVVSEKRSYCLKESDLQGSLRLVGMMVALEPPVGKQPSGFGPQNKGDALYLFARGTQAYVMYQARSLPNQPAGDTSVVVPAWSFHFCADGGHGNRSKAAARWIPDTVTEITGDAAQVKGKDDDVVGGGGGQLSYGWMACANGCCQFYGPPPQQDLETIDPQPSKGNDPPVRPARRAADCPV
ncbi:MAG TPA: hypothetical protein VHG91_08755, partial [Longimicrobium sp.]|nr:hypothetical protein [Longimicrobium sp.]